MSARNSDQIVKMTSLHVPTRRENINSNVSVQLGTDHNQMRRDVHTSHSKRDYPVMTRFDNKQRDTLNVNDLKSSSALNDKKHHTVNEQFL